MILEVSVITRSRDLGSACVSSLFLYDIKDKTKNLSELNNQKHI